MLKLKLQYFGHLMRRTDSLEKTLMLGKTEGGRRRGRQRMRWLDGITNSSWTWVWASSGSWWWTGKPGMLQSMGSQRVGHDWATELKWTVFGMGRNVPTLQHHGLQHTSLPILHSGSSLRFMSIESVMPSNHLILCHPLLLLPLTFPSIRLFSNESILRIRWPKYWSFSFSISPPNEHPGLISFRMDWLDLLAVQGTHKSLLQHHSLKASILRHLAFFLVQLSHPYMTTGKTIALTIWTFVSKVMSLLFNTLSRFVLAFLPVQFVVRPLLQFCHFV